MIILYCTTAMASFSISTFSLLCTSNQAFYKTTVVMTAILEGHSCALS